MIFIHMFYVLMVIYKKEYLMKHYLLQELKKALQNGDKKEVNRIVRALNQLGMDNTTIKILLKEI